VTRIIKTSTPGKERDRLSKAIVIAIREFMRLKEPNAAAKDMVAFVILALREISEGIEKSVAAWEKRGYWLKADKYRMDWLWAGQLAERLAAAFDEGDWPAIAGMLVEVMKHFQNIKVSDRHRMGQPWLGAFKKYQALQE
jgi:hypothetical protein